MTAVGRLTLVSHAMTDAMAAARFPIDEPLNDIGRRQAEAVAPLEIGDARQLAGQELRAIETARILGLSPTTDSLLADLDWGSWCGRRLDGIQPAKIALWQNDPNAAPHGGESICGLIDRVAAWLKSATVAGSRTVAVTHPAVVRAAVLLALDAPPKSFWHIDVAPLSRTVLHFRGGRWTVRL